MGEPSELIRVAVCVVTYRRPELLRALAASLDALEPPPGATVELLVVDNDAETPLGAPPPVALPARYVVERTRGVSAARNRALEAAPAGTDFVVFVDDDEVVDPAWLRELLRVQRATGATAVQGVVAPRFAARPPAWILRGGYFSVGPFPDGAPLSHASTNNVLIDKRWADARGLRFDMRFNRTGGEDQAFFAAMLLGGGRIVGAAGARVTDAVPAARIGFRWVARREFRTGAVLGRIALIHRRGVALRGVKGVGKIAVGLTRALLDPLRARSPLQGVVEAIRGLGMLAAFLGVGLEEYGDRAVAADRLARSGA